MNVSDKDRGVLEVCSVFSVVMEKCKKSYNKEDTVISSGMRCNVDNMQGTCKIIA